MIFSWTPEQIRFFLDASAKSDYDRLLAARIREAAPEAETICDAGCGLGGLSLALSARFSSVTAIDCSENAIGCLREQIAGKGVDNVAAIQADLMTYTPPTPFDAMVFCYFGQTEEILQIASRCCRGTVLLVKRNYDRHRFALQTEKHTRDTADSAAVVLRERGIRFRREDLETEFGQPFRSLSDAVRFFRLYDGGAVTEAAVREKLLATGDKEFPFYFPQKKRVSLLWFRQ